MKQTKENRKLFGVLNVVDLIIIALVIVAAIGVYVFFSINLENTGTSLLDLGEEGKKKYNVTLEIKSAEKYIYDAALKDDKVYNRASNVLIGKINDVRYNEVKKYNISEIDGSTVEAVVPDLYNIEIDMEINETDEVYVGKYMDVRNKYFAADGYLVAFEEIETEEDAPEEE